ncbi:hypothetical protein FO014_15210 [Serratia rhizosphaerae]|uniref:Uncharacterized protein n=1 Tax=Serratia rhizosphaerae TaxID=2597702 RepID=A0ABX6GPM5_9GAMM|nr:hypothetical protein FO014_15210 [Serratia rhizosphaerae]
MPLRRDKQAQVIRTGSERPGPISGWPTVPLGCTGDLITMGRYANMMLSLTLRCLGITNRGFMAGIA